MNDAQGLAVFETRQTTNLVNFVGRKTNHGLLLPAAVEGAAARCEADTMPQPANRRFLDSTAALFRSG